MISMGSAQDIIQTFANREIRAHFSPFEGWECQRTPFPATRDTVFLLTRDIRGKKETVALAVSFDEEPSVTALAGIAVGHTGRHAIKGQYLLVPKDANVSAVPGHIRILPMSTFGFSDGELIWLTKKKGVKHYPQPEMPAKARVIGTKCEPHAA